MVHLYKVVVVVVARTPRVRHRRRHKLSRINRYHRKDRMRLRLVRRGRDRRSLLRVLDALGLLHHIWGVLHLHLLGHRLRVRRLVQDLRDVLPRLHPSILLVIVRISRKDYVRRIRLFRSI